MQSYMVTLGELWEKNRRELEELTNEYHKEIKYLVVDETFKTIGEFKSYDNALKFAELIMKKRKEEYIKLVSNSHVDIDEIKKYNSLIPNKNDEFYFEKDDERFYYWHLKIVKNKFIVDPEKEKVRSEYRSLINC